MISKTQLAKKVKSELVKVEGKTIKHVTWRENNMTIHFTDETHLLLVSNENINQLYLLCGWSCIRCLELFMLKKFGRR